MDDLQQLKLPHNCFYVLESTGELVCIVNGQKGYYNSDYSTDSTEHNKKTAAYMNEKLGLTPFQVEAMVNGSIFGWDSPIADPEYLAARAAKMRAEASRLFGLGRTTLDARISDAKARQGTAQNTPDRKLTR